MVDHLFDAAAGANRAALKRWLHVHERGLTISLVPSLLSAPAHEAKVLATKVLASPTDAGRWRHSTLVGWQHNANMHPRTAKPTRPPLARRPPAAARAHLPSAARRHRSRTNGAWCSGVDGVGRLFSAVEHPVAAARLHVQGRTERKFEYRGPGQHQRDDRPSLLHLHGISLVPLQPPAPAATSKR